MLRLAEVEVDKEERPLSPHKIRSSEVSMFWFETWNFKILLFIAFRKLCSSMKTWHVFLDIVLKY